MRHSNSAYFTLSTGRCGTQWLHYIFNKYYQDEIDTTHEPLHNDYEPRKQLNHKNKKEFLNHASSYLKEHIDHISHTLKIKSYFETGHPSWSSLKYLNEILEGGIKVIFITREPISLVKSWMAHGAYEKPVLPHIKEKTLIHPSDQGVLHTDYLDGWNDLVQPEKILYYWLELNSFAIRWLDFSKVRFIRLKYEDLFARESIETITDFMDLKFNSNILKELDQKVDKYNFKMNFDVNGNILNNHPAVKRLCQTFQYTY